MKGKPGGKDLNGQRGREYCLNIIEMDKNRVPISRMYLSMALPVVLTMVTTMVYNIADTWFISAIGNTNLIAGVSLNAPVLTILMAFGNIYAQGGSSLISRLLGQQKKDSVRQVSSACFYLSILTGLICLAVMLVFRTPILYLLGASEETMEYASAYFVWLAIGAPIIIASYIPNNLLRSEGMSKEAMIDTMSGTILNIILDPIFIFVFGLGAAGAAMATVVGYLFMDILGVVIILKKSSVLSVSLKESRTEGRYIRQIFSVGIPAAISNIMQSVSVIFVNQFLLPYGNDKIAAMGIALKVALVGQLVLVGLTFGSLPLYGYYYGSRNREKFMELLHYCLKFICATAAVLTIVLVAAARPLIRFFVDDAGLIEAGTLMLRLQVVTLIFAGIVLLFTIVFQSMGRAKEMLFLTISRQGVIFVIVLFIASRVAGYYGIIASQAISDLITAAFAIAMYQHWKKEDWGVDGQSG